MLELTAGVGAEKDVGDLGRLDEGLAVRALGDGVAVAVVSLRYVQLI